MCRHAHGEYADACRSSAQHGSILHSVDRSAEASLKLGKALGLADAQRVSVARSKDRSARSWCGVVIERNAVMTRQLQLCVYLIPVCCETC